jgi:hypothetical protein
MGQIQFTVSLVLAGLFIIAILGFCVQFAVDNNSPINIAEDTEIYNSGMGIYSNVSGFNTGSESTYNSTISSSINPNSASGTTATAGQFAITPFNIVGIISNILYVGYSKIFGSGSGFGIFITTFIGIIVFMISLFIWKTWAGRSPD